MSIQDKMRHENKRKNMKIRENKRKNKKIRENKSKNKKIIEKTREESILKILEIHIKIVK